VLYYFKNYPTFDALGTHFDMGRSKACENVHKLTPLLHKTLASLEVLPEREFASSEAFKAALAEADISSYLLMSPSVCASVLVITRNSANIIVAKKAAHLKEHAVVRSRQSHPLRRSDLCWAYARLHHAQN
jgi:hypothetical protein